MKYSKSLWRFYLINIFNLAGFILFGQTSNGTIYFSVVNVHTIASGSENKDIRKAKEFTTFVDKASTSLTYTDDNFLVPFILNEIADKTTFNQTELVEQTKNLKDEDVIILISLNKLDGLIEYQFDVRQKVKDSEFKQLSKSSFFIDPRNKDHRTLISTEIQRVFSETEYGNNKPPEAKIRLDGELVSSSKFYFRSNLDTIILDATSSIDDNTPNTHLTYKWEAKWKSNKENTDFETAFIPGFQNDNGIQKLIINEPGNYSFSVKVDDGIEKSEISSVEISIEILKKPVLELHQNKMLRIAQKSLF